MFILNRWAALLPVFSILLTSGCGTPAPHPNQLNAFDGATYDTLLAAHGALTPLRAQVATGYPKYVPLFNQANAAYGLAYTTYASFRSNPTSQAQVALEIANLTVAVIALESTLQGDLQVPASKVTAIQGRARGLRASAVRAGISLSDILTVLQIASAVARTIPQASPFAALAEIIIQATSSALAATTAATGQPIDLTLIQPIPALP